MVCWFYADTRSSYIGLSVPGCSRTLTSSFFSLLVQTSSLSLPLWKLSALFSANHTTLLHMSFAIHCFTSGHRTPPLTLTRNSLRAPGEEAASQASCPKLTLSQDLDFSRALFPCNKSADDRVTFSAKKNGNLSFRPGQPLSEASALPGAVDILALYLCMTLSWHNTHTLTHRDTLTPDRSSPRRARAHTHFFSAKGFRGPLFFCWLEF